MDAADGVIEHNQNRVPKKMRTSNGTGEVVQIVPCRDEREESWRIVETIRDLRNTEGKRYSDFAVLVRTNAQTRPLEEAFYGQQSPTKLLEDLNSMPAKK